MNNWVRVKKDSPCPICGKPDWCMIKKDGSAAICARQSHGAKRKMECGNLHELGHQPEYIPKPVPRPAPVKHNTDWPPMQERFVKQGGQHPAIWTHLDISMDACVRLGVGWSKAHNAWTWPMKTAEGVICGFSLRTLPGKKFTITGSKSGLYIPDRRATDKPTLIVCEGPTDTAAMLSLGFEAIGRPGCSVCRSLVHHYIRRHGYANVVIMADSDGPGRKGAMALATLVAPSVRSCKVISPPRCKDARDWVAKGATHETVEATIVSTPQHPLKVPGEPSRRAASEGANVRQQSGEAVR